MQHSAYHIDNRHAEWLNDWMDPATGEILPDAPPEPELDISKTIGSIKSRKDTLRAIKEEEDRLKRLKAAIEKETEYLKSKLAEWVPPGEKHADRVKGESVYWTKSEAVELQDEKSLSGIPDIYLKIKRTPDKTALKKALKQGENIEGAFLKTNNNIVVR